MAKAIIIHSKRGNAVRLIPGISGYSEPDLEMDMAEEAKRGRGRPKGSVSKWVDHKTGRIVLACTEDEAARIRELAAQNGKTISRFVVDRVLEGS